MTAFSLSRVSKTSRFLLAAVVPFSLCCLTGVTVSMPASAAVNDATEESWKILTQAYEAYKRKDWNQVIVLSTKAIGREKPRGYLFVRAYLYRGRAYEELAATVPEPQSTYYYMNAVRDFGTLPPGSAERVSAQPRLDKITEILKGRDGGGTPTDNKVPPHITIVTPPPAATAEPPFPSAPAYDFSLDNWLAALKDPKSAATQPTRHLKPMGALAVSGNGLMLATGSSRPGTDGEQGEVALWDLKNGTPVLHNFFSNGWASNYEGKGPVPAYYGHFGRVTALAFSPGGWWVASGGFGGGVTLWDTRSGKAFQAVRDEKALSDRNADKAPIVALGWQGESAALRLVALDADGRLFAWKWDNGTFTKAVETRLQSSTTLLAGWVKLAVMDPAGQRIAVGDDAGRLSVFDETTGYPTREPVVASQSQEPNRAGVPVTAVAFSPDGGRIAVACHSHIYVFPAAADGPDPLLKFSGRVGILPETVLALTWETGGILLARTDKRWQAVKPANLEANNAGSKDAMLGEAALPIAGGPDKIPPGIEIVHIPGRPDIIEGLASPEGPQLRWIRGGTGPG